MPRLFKTLALAALAALSSVSSFAASPAATQSWVKHYVATNSPVRPGFDTRPSVFNVTNELGEAETIVLNWESATNSALIVEGSAVAGLPNGTTFAKTAAGLYENPRLIACPSFTGAREQYGTRLSDGYYQFVTNGTAVTTNVIYRTTNEVWMTRYTMRVGGKDYKTVEVSSGYHIAKPVNGQGGVFYLRAKLISDAEFRRIMLPPNRVSWLSLVCPSALAVTRDTPYVTGVDEYPDKTVTHYEAHWRTDTGDMAHIELGTVSIISANGQTMTYELGVLILDIGAGIDICEINAIDVPDDLAEQIDKAVEEAVGRNRAIQLRRSQEYADAVESRITEAKNALSALKRDCPDTWDDEEAKPPDEPEPPQPHECTIFSGECGHWMCVECKAVYASPDDTHPANHNFTSEGGGCKKCEVCGRISPNEADHTGWHDEDVIAADGPGGSVSHPNCHFCVCKCGRFSLSHAEGETIHYVPGDGPLVCLRVWMCARCGKVIEPDGHDGCTVTPTSHAEKGGGKYTAVTIGDNDICRLSYICDHGPNGADGSLGCGAERTEDFYHVFGYDKALCRDIGDDEVHGLTIPCINGFNHWSDDASEWADNNTNWCGTCLTTNTEAHAYGSWIVMRWDADGYRATQTAHKKVRVCGILDADYNVNYDSVHTCGHVQTDNEAHTMTGTSYGYIDEDTHDVSNYCSKCHGWFYAYTTNHIETADSWYWIGSESEHAVSNICSDCHHAFPRPNEAHEESSFFSYGNGSVSGHAVSNYCLKCSHNYFFGTESHEDPLVPSVEVRPYTWVRNGVHAISNKCLRAGCGALFPNPTRPEGACDTLGGWTLRDNEETDLSMCSLCNHESERPHDWKAIGDEGHYCANGGGHLRFRSHEYGSDDVCDLCGWNRDTHQEEPTPDPPAPVVTTNFCASCVFDPINPCYSVYTDGVLTETHCDAGWDLANERCGCTMCQLGLMGFCTCRYHGIFDGPAVGPMDGSNN